MSGAWRARRVGRPVLPPALGEESPPPARPVEQPPLPTWGAQETSESFHQPPGENRAGAWRKIKCRWDRHVPRVHSIISLGI